MESIAYFEKKLSLTPSDFNLIRTDQSMDQILTEKAREGLEMKCSEQGFILPGSIKLLSRSMGYFEAARFTGDAVYYVKLEGRVIYPVDGIKVVGEVIRKNKMGLYLNYKDAIRIQIPRDLHIGNIDYDRVQVGEEVEVELKRSKFSIHDAYILASGLFVRSMSGSQAELVEESEEEESEVASEVASDASEPQSEPQSEEDED
jgi:hypothetical protein